jgi:hypothetical protein
VLPHFGCWFCCGSPAARRTGGCEPRSPWSAAAATATLRCTHPLASSCQHTAPLTPLPPSRSTAEVVCLPLEDGCALVKLRPGFLLLTAAGVRSG